MTSTFNGVVVGLNERAPSSDDVYPLLNLLWGQGSGGTVHFVLTPLGSGGAAPRLGPGAIGVSLTCQWGPGGAVGWNPYSGPFHGAQLVSQAALPGALSAGWEPRTLC